MSNGPLVKIAAAKAADICARLDLDKQALGLLRDGMKPGEFLASLMAQRQYVTGIDFLAHALPAREGIWWGCLCLQHACGGNLTAPDGAACRAAVEWVLWPAEARAVAAKAQAEAAGPGSPAGLLALAANSAGSPGPAPMPPAKAVANAVKLAITKGDPARFADTQRQFVELGTGLAEGRWPLPEG